MLKELVVIMGTKCHNIDIILQHENQLLKKKAPTKECKKTPTVAVENKERKNLYLYVPKHAGVVHCVL